MSAALAAALAGCGSDSDADSASAEGEIRIMSMAPITSQSIAYPQAKVAAEARVKAINEAGGIGGKAVVLDFCDTKLDPNAEAACIRQAQKNKDVAIVGALTVNPSTYAALERTDIPLIGGWAILPQDFTTENVYQYTAGVPGWFGGNAAIMAQEGVKTVGIIQCDTPGCANAGGTVAKYSEIAGLDVIATETAPLSVTDPSAIASKVVSKKPDAIVFALTAAGMAPAISAVKQAGFDGLMVTNTGGFPPDAQAAAGEDAAGMLLTAQVKPRVGANLDDPGVAQFVEEMKNEDDSVSADDNSAMVWGSWYLFEQLAKTMSGEITSASIVEALDNIDTPLETGIAAPFTTSEASPLEDAPRLFSRQVFVQEFDGKELTLHDGGELDFIAALGL